MLEGFSTLVFQFAPHIFARAALPNGWKIFHHKSGVTLYYENKTGVVVTSRPYTLAVIGETGVGFNDTDNKVVVMF